MSPAWAPLALVLNALIWGLSWWPFREMQTLGLHPLWATGVLYAIALCVLLLLQPGSIKRCAGHPELLWLALAAGLTNVGFNWAVTVGDVVRVVLLFYLMPAWVVLLAWPLLGERPTPRALMRLVLALAGVVVVLKTPEAPWPWPEQTSDWLALAGGLCFAVTNILLRRFHAAPEGARMVAMLGGASVLALAAGGVASQLNLATTPSDIAWLPWAAGTGMAFLVANLGLQYGAARLRANVTSLIMLTEVVFAATSSVLLGASVLSWQTVWGGALILSAALWAALDN
jgi:drug/metabolite transporter (DMT)-like permease